MNSEINFMKEILISILILILSVGGNLLYFFYKRKQFKKEEASIIEDVKSEIINVDKELSEKYNELLEKNSVIFDCPCNHNKIRTFIDLSLEENTFICPECKNEYRVDIRMVPILKGKIVNDNNVYNLLKDKLKSL